MIRSGGTGTSRALARWALYSEDAACKRQDVSRLHDDHKGAACEVTHAVRDEHPGLERLVEALSDEVNALARCVHVEWHRAQQHKERDARREAAHQLSLGEFLRHKGLGNLEELVHAGEGAGSSHGDDGWVRFREGDKCCRRRQHHRRDAAAANDNADMVAKHVTWLPAVERDPRAHNGKD